MSARFHSLSAVPSAVLLAIATVIAGCGGGGDSNSVATSPAVSAEAPAASTVNTALGVSKLPATPLVVPNGYYVDSVNGNDANAGTAAAPWRTLAKVMSTVRMQSAGAIYLACGSVWRESLNLTETQLADGATITSYGDSRCNGEGSAPKISGADTFNGGWTKSGQVWRRTIGTGIPKIKSLSVNGVRLLTARWPNATAAGAEYGIVPSNASASTTLLSLSTAASAAIGSNDLRGARLLVRTEPWFIEERTVSQVSGNNAQFQSATAHAVKAGNGFIIQDKLWLLDAAGEFYHDEAAGVLYVFPPTTATQADLNSALVEGAVRSAPLVVHGRRNLTVSKLSVDMSTGDGMAVNEASSAVVDGVIATNNAQAGIRVNLSTVPTAPARGVIVRNSVVSGNDTVGIDADNVRDGDVLNNTVTQTGMLHAGWSIAAIIGGPGARIDGNTIQKTAFRGIQFSGFGSSRVSNNVVSEFCVRLDDCAAIYTYNGGQAPSGLVQGATVESNRVDGSALNVTGTIDTRMLAGIYIDDLSRMATVRNNKVSRVPIGIFLHNTSDSRVEGNKVWMSTDTSLMVSMDHSTGPDLLKGNTFTGNQLVPAASISGTYPALPQTASSRAVRFWHAQQGSASLTSGSNVFTANQMVAFNGDTSIIAEIGRTDGQTLLSAAEWKALNPGEATPSSPVYYDNYRTLLGAELMQGGDFEAGLGNWYTWFSPLGSGGGLALVTDAAACASKCARYTSGTGADHFSSPLFNMVAGKQYSISFKARFVANGSIPHPDIANPYPPYTSFVDSQGLKTSNVAMHGAAGQTLNYQAFFTATSGSAAVLNLRINEARVPVDYDSVSLRPVTGYAISNFSDWGRIVAAPLGTSVNVSCASLGWAAGCAVVDIDGVAVPMPTTVAAGQSRMLLQSNSTWRR